MGLCVCLHIHIYMYIHTYIYTYIYMCVCIIYMCVCIYVCVHTYIYDEAKMQQGAFCIINTQSPAIATARLHQLQLDGPVAIGYEPIATEPNPVATA